MTLRNGVELPRVGYGVFLVDPAETERCVSDALEVGYRSIDTAQAYGNEEGVGKALAASGLDRSEVFVTTKVWFDQYGQEKAHDSVERSLEKLGTDYVDLLLLHQPFNDYYGAWRALEEFYREGRARSIGVSNFVPDRLVDLANFAEEIPMVNQVETHPLFAQTEPHAWMEKYGVVHEAWSPLGAGRAGVLDNEAIARIAQAHDVTPAQVVLRWHLQHDVVVIPKSVHRERMVSNFDLWGFELSAEEMATIDAMDTGKTLFHDHATPEAVETFLGMIDRKPRRS